VSAIKTLAFNLLRFPGMGTVLRTVMSGRAAIFMLHRFKDPAIGSEGHDPHSLRQCLEYLRRNKYEVLPLSEIFHRLAGEGPPLQGAIAFTMDDGYVDQATVGGQIFADYDCPATVFLSTGFLDGELWFWWNKIEFVFRKTQSRSLHIPFQDKKFEYHLDDNDTRLRAQLEFTEHCKELPDSEKHASIARLADEADVDLPLLPPIEYTPMTWDQVRHWEKRGLTFGPHTVTHPILSRTTLNQTRHELVVSWQRLCAEVRHPIPIFCYPNGRWKDFGSREIEILKSIGMIGGLVGEPGYARACVFRHPDVGPFRVQRFAYTGDIIDMAECVSGIERIKEMIRRDA
jgi:peptidoglycan/xylan/chitin deacetylase (PgdA/CDA1 family)